MKITWKLTGKPGGAGECEHCGRGLVHRYEVTSSESRKMIVGRGCLKAVTGWTLTAAQAASELRMIGIRAKRAANWAAFAELRPEAAEMILADVAGYAAQYGPGYPGGPSHEVKLWIEDAAAGADAAATYYLTRRREYPWTA